MLLTIIIFLVVLGLLVFVHELGHFAVARRFGVKAEEFGFGFPPRAIGVQFLSKPGEKGRKKWKIVRGRGEPDYSEEEKGMEKSTIYSLNWVPLGGFVKIKGENGESADPDSFAAKPAWQRAIILLAGVSMNIILAMALFTAGFMYGLPQVLDDIGPGAKVKNEQIMVADVLPGSPADQAGVKAEDAIVAINGRSFIRYEELQSFTAENVGEPLVYELKRGPEAISLTITPEVSEQTGDNPGIGIAIMETGLVSYPFYLALGEGIRRTIILTGAIVVAFYELLKNIVIGQGVTAEIAGPIGIAALTGQVAKLGFIYIVQFTALLSVNLAIINAVPFPPLDGGRILFLAIEKLKGRPVRRELEAVVHNIGFLLLMVLIVLVTFKDVARYGQFFKNIWSKIAG